MEMKDKLGVVLNLELQMAVLRDMLKTFESIKKDIEKITELAEAAENIVIDANNRDEKGNDC